MCCYYSRNLALKLCAVIIAEIWCVQSYTNVCKGEISCSYTKDKQLKCTSFVSYALAYAAGDMRHSCDRAFNDWANVGCPDQVTLRWMVESTFFRRIEVHVPTLAQRIYMGREDGRSSSIFSDLGYHVILRLCMVFLRFCDCIIRGKISRVYTPCLVTWSIYALSCPGGTWYNFAESQSYHLPYKSRDNQDINCNRILNLYPDLKGKQWKQTQKYNSSQMDKTQ